MAQRREFIKTSIIGTVGLTLASSTVGSLLSSCSLPRRIASGNMTTGFEQDPLPYSFDALENVIDGKTMDIHYTKHAAAYAKNLKEAAQTENIDIKRPLEDVLANISRYSSKVRNNGGGHYNHEMFWKCMRPRRSDNRPSGKLLSEIESHFSSFDKFKTQFSDAGKNRFGSGWAWLYADKNKALKIGSTPNQDNPLMDVSDIKGFPLLGLDVWEHAYYLKYQNRRADYIDAWWNVVNWDYVASRYSVL